MTENVHYVWLVDDVGFLQSHQITTRSRKQVLAFLRKGLREFEALGRGAAIVEVTLDETESEVLDTAVTYNELASTALRRHIDRHLASFGTKVPKRASAKRLTEWAGKKRGKR